MIRRLKQLQLAEPSRISCRGRSTLYGPNVTVALKEVWELFNEICAERLRPQLGEYVKILRGCAS